MMYLYSLPSLSLFTGSPSVTVHVSLAEFKQFLCDAVVQCITGWLANTTLREVLATDAVKLLWHCNINAGLCTFLSTLQWQNLPALLGSTNSEVAHIVVQQRSWGLSCNPRGVPLPAGRGSDSSMLNWWVKRPSILPLVFWRCSL